MANSAIDFSALEVSVSSNDIDKYIKQEIKKQWTYPINGLLFGLTILFAASAVIAIVIGFILNDGQYMPISLGCLIASIVSMVIISQNKIFFGTEMKLKRLSMQNGLLFNREYKDDSRHKGLIFRPELASHFRNVVASNDEQKPAYEFGRYESVEKNGKHQKMYAWRYISIELGRNLPHIVLDSKRNNHQMLGVNVSNLPVSYKRDQILSLEGDFDKYYTLYAPQEYERDALYIFTPDLMALMMDEASPFDAEIIDNRIYFYMRDENYRYQGMAERKYLQQVFRIVSLVGGKVYGNTDSYSDQRAPGQAVDTVDPKGRRLKARFGWIAAFVVATYIVLTIAYLLVSFSS